MPTATPTGVPTVPYLNGPDISAGHPIPFLGNAQFIGLKVCLGSKIADPSYFPNVAKLKTAWPTKRPFSYIFLSGPLRYEPIAAQIGLFAQLNATHMTAIDWETDEFDEGGKHYNFGRQPFSAVVDAILEARKHGLNPGVYASENLLTPDVIAALIKLGVPFIWAAMYPGPLPDRILHCGLPIIHQYVGVGTDWNRAFFSQATLDELAGFAVPPPAPEVNAVKFAVPYTPTGSARELDVPVGTQLYWLDGTPFEKLNGPAGTTLNLITTAKADAHDGQFVVIVDTGAAYADNVKRPTEVLVKLPGGVPK